MRLVVELAGLPGAGKTTLAACTSAAVVAAGVDCRVADAGISAAASPRARALRRVRLAGSELVRHPLRSAGVLRAIRALGSASSRDAAAGAVQWLAVQRLVAQARRLPGVTLVEEGPVQTAWTLALRARGDLRPLLRCLAEGCALPDLLVVVDAPTGVVSRRLGGRPSRHSRTQLLPPRERVGELDAGRTLMHDIVTTVDRPGLLVVNDGACSPGERGEHTARWVLRNG
ncbi:MAG: hypothetical protein ACRDPH_10765 [Marmoricola sp.]